MLFICLLLISALAAGAQSIDVTPYVLPVDPAHHGAEIAEIHPAFDLDPRVADFGGQQVPGVWRSLAGSCLGQNTARMDQIAQSYVADQHF